VDPRDLAQDLLKKARAAGASAADLLIADGTEFSVTIRKGQIETLKEAGSKALGIRVFVGKRTASSYTSDFSLPALDALVAETVSMARATGEDAAAGLPEEMIPAENLDLGLHEARAPLREDVMVVEDRRAPGERELGEAGARGGVLGVGVDPGPDRVQLLEPGEDLRALAQRRDGHHVAALGLLDHPRQGVDLVGEDRDLGRPSVDGSGPEALHDVLGVAAPQVPRQLRHGHVVGASRGPVGEGVDDVAPPVTGGAEREPHLSTLAAQAVAELGEPHHPGLVVGVVHHHHPVVE